MRGRFITIEGGEGAGKSTCLSTVVGTLRKHDIDVITTREPGGTELAEEIRSLLLTNRETGVDPVTELMLMFTARHDHLQTIIRPALDRGTWVVCDRFTDATYAYQGGGRNVDRSRIQDLETFVQQGLQPDLTLLLDVAPEIGLRRALKDREADRFETEKIDFYERVRQAYLERYRQDQGRFRLIDASQPVADVVDQIETQINAYCETVKDDD